MTSSHAYYTIFKDTVYTLYSADDLTLNLDFKVCYSQRFLTFLLVDTLLKPPTSFRTSF